MGCLARLGCLILLVILACVAWFTRDAWMPERLRPFTTTTTPANAWQPATTAGARRAREALTRLSRPGGAAYETISAGDLISLVAQEITTRVGGAPDSVAARIDRDRFVARAFVDFSAMRSKLGTIASLIRDHEMVELTGTFHMLHPGLAEFEVLEARIGRVALPRSTLPRVIQAIDHGERPADVRPEAFPLPMPASVRDIRIANGKVTLYKNVN